MTSQYQISVPSHVWLFLTPWTVAHQAPLSIEFSRQERSGLPFPTPGDLPDPRIKYASPASPALASWFFTTAPPGNVVNVRANTHTPVRLCPLPMVGERSITLHWCSGVAYCSPSRCLTHLVKGKGKQNSNWTAALQNQRLDKLYPSAIKETWTKTLWAKNYQRVNIPSSGFLNIGFLYIFLWETALGSVFKWNWAASMPSTHWKPVAPSNQ